jgi:hypothetical protein
MAVTPASMSWSPDYQPSNTAASAKRSDLAELGLDWSVAEAPFDINGGRPPVGRRIGVLEADPAAELR